MIIEENRGPEDLNLPGADLSGIGLSNYERRRMNNHWRERICVLGLIVGLVLFGTALVWHDLGSREVLGQDENATITKLDQPNLKAALEVTRTKVSRGPSNTQPLYFLLQRLFWPLVKRSAFMLRFLPSVFGLLGVVLTYKLGEALFGREAGLVGGLLTALLPLHVQYAQIARPYTLLALLSLASAYFLVRALETNRPAYWGGFALTAALNFYTHYSSLFVLAAEGLFTGVIWLVMLVAALRKRQATKPLVGPVICFLVVGFLCAPGIIRLVGLPWASLDGNGPTAKSTVELTWPFFYLFLYEIGLTTVWLQGLILGLIGLGLAASLHRRRWQAALLTLLWLAVPFVVLSLVKSPRPFRVRYIIFGPSVALILAGQGVAAVGQIFGALGQCCRAGWLREAAIVAISAGLALLFAAPLHTYYADNRAASHLELALAVVEHHAQPGDVIVVSPRFLVRPLAVDGAQVLYLTEHLSPAQLDDLAVRYERMWILYTSFLPAIELQEPLDRWVQAQQDEFVRVLIGLSNALAYRNMVLADAEANLRDRIALLEELAQASGGKQEAWQRYSVLADAYQSLADLYTGQGKFNLAAEYQKRAEETRAAAPHGLPRFVQ